MKIDTGFLVDDLVRWQGIFIDNLKIRNKSKHTIRSFTKKIDDFIEFCRTQDEISKIVDINKIFINLFILEVKESILKRKKTISNWTINSYITALRSFFAFISDNNDEMIDFIPLFNKIKPLKVNVEVPRFTPEENKKILLGLYREMQTNNIKKIRNILAIYILYYSGLRAFEILNIKFKDIFDSSDFDFLGIKVLGKGNKERRVHIKRSHIKELLEKISNGMESDKKVFPISYTTFYQNVNAFLRRCGILNKKGIHIFRHNLATLLVQKNINMQIIQDILGHSNIATTARFYSRVEESTKIRALEQLDEKY